MASSHASCRRIAAFPLALAINSVMLAFVPGIQAQTPPAPPVTPPPPAAFQDQIPAGQLAFLNGYSGRTTRELMKDKQFKAALKLLIPKTEYHYGRDMPLSDAVSVVLSRSPLPVNIRDGRFVSVSGMEGPYLRGRGFLWFDLQQGIALGGFFFTPTNGEPTPTLTIFSRQLKQTAMTMGQLPPDFVQDLEQWSLVSRVPAISPRYFIPENGKKYVLEHDEDYCTNAAGAPPSPQDHCMQANLDEANADMDAAYFMQETDHRANATAWMLDPQQSAWLAMRDTTCIGLDGLGCRVRMTRERIRVILGRPRPRAM